MSNRHLRIVLLINERWIDITRLLPGVLLAIFIGCMFAWALADWLFPRV